ncbi:hypothetical protein [Streptomyces sp. NPDC047079]|uniref:hypothetical protein n=1 Tax=Streptomyces sp. NPDC047079 TaxID=3154607 RepID=UPI0033BFC577
MTGPDDTPGIPLPAFERPLPGRARHPVLAAVLAELRAREAEDEPPAAYYNDSPDPTPPRLPGGAAP